MDEHCTNTVSLPEADDKRPGFPWLSLALVLVLYPLSTGPAFRLAAATPAFGPYLGILYAPLIEASKACRPVERFFNWYVKDLWAPS